MRRAIGPPTSTTAKQEDAQVLPVETAAAALALAEVAAAGVDLGQGLAVDAGDQLVGRGIEAAGEVVLAERNRRSGRAG